MIVADASVFNKLFLEEPDRALSVALFDTALRDGIALAAPDLIVHEALSVALHYGVPSHVIFDLLEPLADAGMRLIRPTRAIGERAFAIARGEGRPSLQDSTYHAVALVEGGTFVTADERHFRKTRHLGAIMLLRDWAAASDNDPFTRS
ncbi:MAG: type II toxin-antitoxin system VapC family toxin [Phyllobacteriaceae bacterium]|jgi:predicted nucleic acid-binding protein|nr:type II toxin-antitoxin system VapC family toxin [Phyllobacteriaceae bacterium]